MSATVSQGSERILLVAPMGADATNLVNILGASGLGAVRCPDLTTVARETVRGCGAILLTEEAFSFSRYDELSTALSLQPAWSDIPVVLIVSGGQAGPASTEAIRLIGPRSNLTLVERPLRRATLVSTLQTALRARRRQYEVSALLREREESAASLERRVAERTAKLEELNAELEAFSYSVSHDLRGPLRSVETYARILCEDFANTLPEEGRHFAERIARNAEKMDRLMQDVLAFSRVARTDMPMEALDLDSVVAEVIEQYPDLGAARAQIELRSPLGRVFGHAISLTQCLSNLLQNAIKFVPAGRTPHIRVYSEPAADRLRVYVADNGPGIDPAHHARIFGMFERVSGADIPGTGIGLAIVKKAVERMGGTVGVNSVPGEGASFWIELAMVRPRE